MDKASLGQFLTKIKVVFSTSCLLRLGQPSQLDWFRLNPGSFGNKGWVSFSVFSSANDFVRNVEVKTDEKDAANEE